MPYAGLGLLLIGGACSSPPRQPDLVAAYRIPEIPPVCQQEVYNDPDVAYVMRAGAALPTYRAEFQDKLAFYQDRALHKCLQAKGLEKGGGVEPIRYKWYPSPF